MTMVEENVLIQEQADPSDTDTHLIIEAKRGSSKQTIGCDKLRYEILKEEHCHQ